MLYLLVADSHCVSWNESVQFPYQTHSMELKSQHQYYAMSTHVDGDDTGQSQSKMFWTWRQGYFQYCKVTQAVQMVCGCSSHAHDECLTLSYRNDTAGSSHPHRGQEKQFCSGFAGGRPLSRICVVASLINLTWNRLIK